MTGAKVLIMSLDKRSFTNLYSSLPPYLNCKNQMTDIIVASSRGRKLQKLANATTLVHFVKGGRMIGLANTAKKIITDNKVDGAIVYFVAGLPDISKQVTEDFHMNGQKCRYQEAVFTEDINTAVNRMISIISKCNYIIKSANATPVFSTILPIHLETWNKKRLSQHRTSLLTHFKQYQDMQSRLETAITLTNQHIHAFNRSNSVATPRLSKHIIFNRRSSVRTMYGRLEDGCHANERLAYKLRRTLIHVMQKNRLEHPQIQQEYDLMDCDDEKEFEAEYEEFQKELSELNSKLL